MKLRNVRRKYGAKLMQGVTAYKPGLSHFVEIIIAILVVIVVGGVFLTLSNEGMRTLFQDMIGRITSSFN